MMRHGSMCVHDLNRSAVRMYDCVSHQRREFHFAIVLPILLLSRMIALDMNITKVQS
jgi:hypothetical protein